MDDLTYITFKGILWQFYKLGLRVPSGRDKNNGIGHFAELGSSWPGEAKTWPKIALRVGGRAENCVLGDGRSHKSTVLRDGRPRKKSTVFEDGRVHGRPSLNTVLFSPPARPSTHSVALFLATFWPLLASWSRVRQNDLYHRFRLGQTELLSPTCKIATGSL